MIYRQAVQHLYDIERTRIPPTPAIHMRLHRLERPEEWESELHGEMWRAQPSSCYYPDYAAFYERLAEFLGHTSTDRIVVGQGIEGLIRDLVMLSCDPGDALAYTAPTCAMFGLYARIFGARPVPLVINPDHLPPADWIAASLPADTKLLILPNPGQPVETCYDLYDLRLIANRCHELGAVLAIDEAYYGFGAPGATALTHEFDNVVVLRTFSKAFGGAALRIGYAIGGPKVIKPLEACRQSGEVAGPSMHAAMVLMDKWDSHVAKGISAVIAGRTWLRAHLIRDGIPAQGKYANHVLIDMGNADMARAVGERLWNAGARVKFGFEPPVDRHLLVTCGSGDLMRRFYAAFRAAL